VELQGAQMLISQILLVLMLVITQQMLIIQISFNKLVMAQQVLIFKFLCSNAGQDATGAKFSNFLVLMLV
jgi:hypothetical protein